MTYKIIDEEGGRFTGVLPIETADYVVLEMVSAKITN